MPVAILQIGGACIDAAREMIEPLIEEDDHFFEMHALIGHAERVNHRLMRGVSLAQPQTGRRHRELRSLAVNVACLEPGILGEECRGHRIEQRHGQDAEHDGHQQRRRQELPRGNVAARVATSSD